MSETRNFTRASFQAYLDEKQLMGNRCGDCNELHLPARPICPACFSTNLSWEEIPGAGKVAAYTAVYIAPVAMIEAGYGRDNPYLSAVVTLDAGPSISAQIIGVDASDDDAVAVGTPVKLAFIERGEHVALGFEPTT